MVPAQAEMRPVRAAETRGSARGDDDTGAHLRGLKPVVDWETVMIFELEKALHLSRRQFFGRGAASVGIAALAALLTEDGFAASAPSRQNMSPLPGLPHHKPSAKRVIVLWQGGPPSHVDLFDHKPGLEAMRGQQIP